MIYFVQDLYFTVSHLCTTKHPLNGDVFIAGYHFGLEYFTGSPLASLYGVGKNYLLHFVQSKLVSDRNCYFSILP